MWQISSGGFFGHAATMASAIIAARNSRIGPQQPRLPPRPFDFFAMFSLLKPLYSQSAGAVGLKRHARLLFSPRLVFTARGHTVARGSIPAARRAGLARRPFCVLESPPCEVKTASEGLSLAAS